MVVTGGDVVVVVGAGAAMVVVVVAGAAGRGTVVPGDGVGADACVTVGERT